MVNFFRNFAKLSSKNLIAIALPFFILPFLTRFIDANQIGVYTLFYSIVGSLSSIATLKFESAILISNDEENLHLAVIAFLFSSTLFILFLFVCIIFYVFSKPIFSFWFLFAPISIFFNGIIQSLNSLLQRESNFGIIGMGRIILNALSNLLPFLFLLFENLNVLILAYIISQCLTIFYLFQKGGFDLTQFNFLKKKEILFWTRLKFLFSKYKNFAIYDTPGSLLDHGANLIIVSTVYIMANAENAASYGIASKILMFPIALITTPLTQVLLNEFVKLSNNKIELKIFTIKLLKILGTISLAPCLVFAFYSTSIFEFLFGDGWQESGKIVSYFAFSQFLIFVVSPISVILIVLKWNKINSLWKFLRFCFILLISIFVSDDIHKFYIFLSITEFVLYTVYLIIIFKAIKNVWN